MKILITGGAGFIGSQLAQFHLNRGDAVWVIDNLFKTQGKKDPFLNQLLESPHFNFLQLDMTQPFEDLIPEKEWDLIYHSAAINGTRLFYEMSYRVAQTNLLLTLNLLKAIEKLKIGRLIYASTSEVYADSEQVGLLKIPTDEKIPVVFTQPTVNRFSYGTSKFMGEFLCQQFGKEFKVPITTVRYHNIYGPRMGYNHVIPEFILRIQKLENP